MQDQPSGDQQDCDNCLVLRREILALKDDLAEMVLHAFQDALTGLANRRQFVRDLEDRIARCRRYGDNCALLFLDVDNLKRVNDRHGHPAGDALLVCLAGILMAHTRTTDVVARIGGDEFALLLDNLDADQVEAKIAFLVERFGSAECSHAGQAIPFGATIGYCFVGPRDSVEALMSRADAAMYRAKDKSA